MIYLNGRPVEFGKFPNGEVNLNFNKLCILSGTQEVALRFESDADLMHLYMLKKYLDENNRSAVQLIILYMPYSRMDRRNDTYAFTLKYVCGLINSLKFERVMVYDAHSEVTSALLDRCEDLTSMIRLFSDFRKMHSMENAFVYYPDAGAQKRYSKTFCYPTIVGSKERDFSTGEIKKYSVHGEFKAGSDVVIIDDLCSKGGTFVAAAKELKALGANKIYLIVAHCEDTIFDGEIFKGELIDKVYTTNSITTLRDGAAAGRLFITSLI